MGSYKEESTIKILIILINIKEFGMNEEKRLRQRSETDEKYKWNIADMYADEADWEADFDASLKMADDFTSYSGRLGESAELLLEALRARDSVWQKAERVYVYAHMKGDEDNRVSRYQELSQRAMSLMSQISAKTAFFTPELMELPEGTIEKFLDENEDLKMYSYMLLDLLRQRKHILSQQEEALMAQFGEVSGAPKQIFSMINDADIKFGNVKDEDGDEVELTHGNYISMMESSDRRVREDAYKALYAAFIKQKNTLASTYYYNVKKNAVFSKIRKYPSALASALDGDNIPESVYTNLVDTVNAHLDVLHRYVGIRKKMLGVDEIHMYDMYAPLVDMPKRSVPYEEALDVVRNALVPMGEEYLRDLNAGIDAGWIDVYENEGKTSGAYSFGSYDSMPYVLLNYNNKFKDAFTIIHELGHSMNSFYTRKAQPYIYGGHSIFTAEVASTVNECLLMHDLLSKCEDKTERLYLLNIYIEEFRTTVFRQTMFAEFEMQVHAAVEKGEVMTPDRLCEIYGGLNKKYFGPDVVYDDEIAMEWARIPHFYNAFYVYKYATGYSAAVALSRKIIEEGKPARDAYLEFLAAGDSDYPIELLKRAGVDMSKPDVIESAMSTFEGLIDELEELINE